MNKLKKIIKWKWTKDSSHTCESTHSNQNDTTQRQHLGIIHLAFGVDTIEEVEEKSRQLQADGYPILSGPRKTGDGYYEFETLDPDNNRIEVTTVYPPTE